MKYAVLFAAAISVHAESLHYVINWQSGLSLGEATLASSRENWVVGGKEEAHWRFDLDIDASVPGFAVRDTFMSTAAGVQLCSANLDKTIQHGNRKTEELITFDQSEHTLTRETQPPGPGGGKSDTSVPPCARDALSFLQFARQELAQGRLAPQQPAFFGSAYNVRLEFAGAAPVKKLGTPIDADKIRATIKGPASNYTVELFFAKDEARTPVMARIPLSLGTFTVELAH